MFGWWSLSTLSGRSSIFCEGLRQGFCARYFFMIVCFFRGGTCREVHYRRLKNVPTPKGPLLTRCSDGLPHYSNLTMNPIKVACMQDFQWGNYSTLESINQTLINVMIWKEMNVGFKSDCSRHFMLPSDPKLSTYSAGFLVRVFTPPCPKHTPK